MRRSGCNYVVLATCLVALGASHGLAETISWEPLEASAGGRNPFVTPWVEPAARPTLRLAHRLTDHHGTSVMLDELVGAPLAISFVYTSCTNPRKCARVMDAMVDLRARLTAAALLSHVRLVLITYDAARDEPAALDAFAQQHGLTLDGRTLFLRPPIDPERHLYRDLNASVAFADTGIALHGIQLLLVDKTGRLARTYQVVIWDNAKVVEDLARLVRE